MAQTPTVATARARRQHYRHNMLTGFDALAELYYAYWGEYFHLAVFDAGDDPTDLSAAYQRTHQRYLAAIGGAATRRILDVACGGGALSAWLADHTTAEVVGVDLSAASSPTPAAGLRAGAGPTCGSSSTTSCTWTSLPSRRSTPRSAWTPPATYPTGGRRLARSHPGCGQEAACCWSTGAEPSGPPRCNGS
jgi:hypothetical protein